MRLRNLRLHSGAAILLLLGTTEALAQTEPVAPAASGYKSEGRTIIEMQLHATGPATSTSSAEANQVYKHYLADIGKPIQQGQGSSPASSGSNSASGPSSGGSGN